MGFTTGDPLPDITTTTTKATEAPQYYTDYLSGLSQAGTSAMAKTPDQLVAGYDPLQTTGYGKFESAAGAYQPGLEAARSTLTGAGNVTPADIQRFMNPYTQNVVDEMARLSQQNVQRNILPGLKAGAVGSGDLGSRRYASALGQTLADVQSGLTGQQYGALSKGYTEALGAAQREAELARLASAEEARQAGLAQEYGITGAKALTGAGAERQAYEQSRLEAPLKTAANAAALMRGQSIPLTTSEKFTGPKTRDYYKTSNLSDILSIGALLASAKSGSLLEKVGRGLIPTALNRNPSGSTPGGSTPGEIVEGDVGYGMSPEVEAYLNDLGYIQDTQGNWTYGGEEIPLP